MPVAVRSSSDAAELDDLTVSRGPPRRGRRLAAIAAAAVFAIVMVGGFDLLFRLGVPDWKTDELTYRKAGWLGLHGKPSATPEAPPLAKHIIGLFEVLFGRAETPVRASAVVAAILTGVFLALVAWRIADGWAALATAAVWFVLPHPASFKLERFALLDVFMAMFTTLAVLFAVCWGASRRWVWVVAAGFAAGAATACKAPGVLVLAPIGVYVLARGRFSIRALLQASAFAAAAFAAFVATYIPVVGKMPHEVRYMIEFQQRQRELGHLVLVGDRFYKHPPWWTQLRWQWDASWILALCYLIIVVFAVAIALARRDPDRALLLGVLAVTFGFFAFVSGNVLGHYPYAWSPILAVIVGVTLHDLARARGLARVTAVGIALALVIPAGQLINATAKIRRTDYSAAAALLRRTVGPSPTVAITGSGNVLRAYLPEARLVPATPAHVATASAVIFDPATTHGRSAAWQRSVNAHSAALILHKVGRLFVYVPDT